MIKKCMSYDPIALTKIHVRPWSSIVYVPLIRIQNKMYVQNWIKSFQYSNV